MKIFFIYAGVILALYLGVLVWLLSHFPEHDREGAHAMGFGVVLASGALVSAVLIALGGASMLLWHHFVTKSPRVGVSGVLLAVVVMGILFFLGVQRLLAPSYAEQEATWQAERLADIRQKNDIARFPPFIFELARLGKDDEIARLFAAGPFTKQDFLRQVLGTTDSLDDDKRLFFMKLASAHEADIQTWPYRLRSRYKSIQLFEGETALGSDESGSAFFSAFLEFQDVSSNPEVLRQPKHLEPVLKAARRLHADILGCGTPLFHLLTLPSLQVFQPPHGQDLLEGDQERRKSTLVVLKENGLELSAEEKQDAELQDALRAAGLGALLE
jgi:hypothetical protein